MRRASLLLVPLFVLASIASSGTPASASRLAPGRPSLLPPPIASAMRRAGLRNDLLLFAIGGGGELNAEFRVPGSPYHWSFSVSRARHGWALDVSGYEQGLTTSQDHDWEFHLPRGAVAIGRRLKSARVHTGTRLGAFGSIDLTFSSARPRKVHTFECGKPRRPLERDFRRTGTLRGTMDFTPNEGTLPDLQLTHVLGTVRRSHFFRGNCNSGDGGHRPQTCYPQQGVGVYDPTQHTSIGVSQFGHGSPFEMDAFVQRRVGPALEFHILGAESLSHLDHISSTGLTFDASTVSPAFSGSMVLEKGAVTTHVGRRCRITRTREIWSSGTLTANLDSGSIDLTGSNLQGLVVDYARP
jgi:hypothetical protein